MTFFTIISLLIHRLTFLRNEMDKSVDIEFSVHDAYAHGQKIGKQTVLKSLGASKQKGLNMTPTIAYGHLYLREKNLIFIND